MYENRSGLYFDFNKVGKLKKFKDGDVVTMNGNFDVVRFEVNGKKVGNVKFKDMSDIEMKFVPFVMLNKGSSIQLMKS